MAHKQLARHQSKTVYVYNNEREHKDNMLNIFFIQVENVIKKEHKSILPNLNKTNLEKIK